MILPILSLSNLVSSIIGGVMTITTQKLSARWGKMAQIQKEQFEQFIKPAFYIFRQILEPSIEYNIIVIPGGNEKAKRNAIEQLKELATDKREYLDDILYKAILSMSEKDLTDIDKGIKLVGKEITRLYFLKRDEVKIKSRFPAKERLRIALSFGQNEPEIKKYWLIKVDAILSVLVPYVLGGLLILYIVAALWQHHFL